MGQAELKVFEREMNAYQRLMQREEDDGDDGNHKPTKDWNFPKIHTQIHMFSDIMNKGVTINFNTKYNENMHGDAKDSYYMSNLRDVAEIIIRITAEQVAGLIIQDRINTYKEALSATSSNNLDQETPNDAFLTPSSSGSLSRFTVGSAQLCTISTMASQIAATYHPSLHDLHRKITKRLAIELSQPLNSIRLGGDPPLVLYRYVKIDYISREDSKLATDILRMNPSFHEQERYDCALVAITGGFIIARLVGILGISYANRKFLLALIIPFDEPLTGTSASIRKRDKDLRFTRVRSRPQSKSAVVSINAIFIMAHQAQAELHLNANRSYLDPTIPGSVQEDTVLQQIGAVHGAMQSTDTTVMKEDSQRLISALHRDLTNVRAELAEARARLVNVAALKRGSKKKVTDKDNGGSGALLVPDAAVNLVTVLAEEAKKLAHHYIYFYSMYNADYLFGTLIDGQWNWKEATERFKDDESRKLGDVAELFSIAPTTLHSYILTKQAPLPDQPEAVADARYARRWRPCLYKNRVVEPSKEFTNPALLLAAEIMIFGSKSIEALKTFLRANNPLKAAADRLEVTAGLIATSAVWVIYLLSGDREFTSDGKGAITGINYKEDFLGYREYALKSWDEPWMKKLVHIWNTRLFPLKPGHAEGEDFSQQVEEAAASWDDTDAMLARAREAAVDWSEDDEDDEHRNLDEEDSNNDFEGMDNSMAPPPHSNPLVNPVPELQALELSNSNDYIPLTFGTESTRMRLAAPPVLAVSSQAGLRMNSQVTSPSSTAAISPLIAAAAAVAAQSLQPVANVNYESAPAAAAQGSGPEPRRRQTRATSQNSGNSAASPTANVEVALGVATGTAIVETAAKKGRGKTGTGAGKKRKT
ncbi:hypothetical protein H1R20_g2721, partial [Candolleomyces eurysporus]